MSIRILLSSILIVLILAGCLPQSEEIDVLSTEASDYELYLYTKKGQDEEAQDYLNAILDWKTKQDDSQQFDFKQSSTQSDNIEVSTDDLPALVIKKEGKVVTSIKGDNPSNKILLTLENSFAYQ
ncbi:hypothetical protein EQV77_05510 [Halobacillus fulvus]|nr:hypothetical protein EQV77_05510 [Halobacillus fulvus]